MEFRGKKGILESLKVNRIYIAELLMAGMLVLVPSGSTVNVEEEKQVNHFIEDLKVEVEVPEPTIEDEGWVGAAKEAEIQRQKEREKRFKEQQMERERRLKEQKNSSRDKDEGFEI